MKSYLQKHDNIKYSDNWSTPKEIYNLYVNELGYHDPCELYSKSTVLKKTIFEDKTLIDDNMFINPPYSDIDSWVDWALYHSNKYKKHIVLLIPSRTDTKYFHKLLNHGCDLEFIKGRLKFGGLKQSAPFPSVLVHLREEGKK